MEVRIQKGHLKGYFATVVGTRWQADDTIWVDLKVSTQPVEHMLSLKMADVVGRL
jgi:hypothetical protein